MPRPDRHGTVVSTAEKDVSPAAPPKGTLFVVAIFGALVALGWLALYVGLFLPRVTP